MQLRFKGVDSPSVYIIDHHAQDEDFTAGYPLSGQRGDFVCSLLGSMGLLGETRFACWTTQYPSIVSEDIVKCNPKVIIGFGSELLKELVGAKRAITEVSGSIYDINIGGNPFKYLAIMSPSYVLKNIDNSSITLKFSQDLYKAFQIVNGEYKEVLKEKIIMSAHSYQEFIEIYNKYFSEDDKLSYDIETNARPPMSKGSKIIGFSLGNKQAGVYISCDSLDFTMPVEDEEKIWLFVINEVFEKKSRLIIHNTMYERPYTLYCKNYEISYDKADDTLVMARLLRGGSHENAGLKFQAQKYLAYPDWESDLDQYLNGYNKMINRIGFGPKKFTDLWNEIVAKHISKEAGVFEIETFDSYHTLDDQDKLDVQEIVNNLKSPCLELYTDEELKNISYKLTETIINTKNQGGIQDSVIPYNYIPDRVLSKYGAVDALATYDLYEYYMDCMDRYSTDKVDLHKGYENWREHMYVAYIMERNGLRWNEDLVKKDEAFLSKQSIDCLRNLLKSPIFQPYIVSVTGDKYQPIIFSDYLPEIPGSQGYKVEYNSITKKFIVYKDGKRIKKDSIHDIKIPEGYLSEYNQIIENLYLEDLDNLSTVDELKELFNPASITSTGILQRIFDVPELQIGHKINSLNTLSESPGFDSAIPSLPMIDQKFLKVAQILCNPNQLKENYKENWAEFRKQFYQGFCSLYRSSKDLVVTPEIKEILDNPKPLVIDSFDDEGIISIYNSLVVTGIDQDDSSTWTPLFRWMMDFRIYKKSQKLLTTYINGVTGRQSVNIVSKSEMASGNNRLERKRLYSEDPVLHEDEAYLMNAKWSPNTALTGRWQSAQHTIPWNSPIKKYYTSRFEGGTLVMPDYSQMEVRTLAAVANDENMLNLFKSGKDFHKETAKSIYRKEEVTSAERRFSKTATFSLLYGSTAESFAKKYCKGDLDYAKMIYDGFYEAYPSVKKWVDARHEEVQRDHQVSLELSNRFIKIEPEDDSRGAINSLLRKGMNYPIQSQSADLTGCVIWDLQKYIEDNNLKSKIIMYVHDSIEIDIPPYEMIQFIDKLKFILNDSPMRRMGLPSHADVALGCSLGHEIEMKSLEHNEDFTECTMVLEGYKDEIEDTIAEWKKVYKTVEISEEEWEDEFISMGDLFILKKAYTPTLGTLRHSGKCKVHINYYE